MQFAILIGSPKREYTTLPLVLDERDYPAILVSGAFFAEKFL